MLCKCLGCGRVNIKARSVELYLDREFQSRRDFGDVRDPEPPPKLPRGKDRDALLAELAAVEERIEELAEQLAGATSPTRRRIVERAIDKLAKREEAARAAIAEAMPAAVLARAGGSWSALYGDEDDLYRRWEASELTDVEVVDLNEMFVSYIQKVEVRPRPASAARGRHSRFDPGRVTITWRR